MIRRKERELTAEYKQEADEKIIENILSLPEYMQAETVFAFVGTEREINTMPLLNAILNAGKKLCVPLCTGAGIMELKEIRALSELSPGTMGILEPARECRTVLPEETDLAIIPCVSCSHAGIRLGHGGGYYDRFLAEYNGQCALICREALMTESIPTEAHDVTIDCVVTERGIFRKL